MEYRDKIFSIRDIRPVDYNAEYNGDFAINETVKKYHKPFLPISNATYFKKCRINIPYEISEKFIYRRNKKNDHQI